MEPSPGSLGGPYPFAAMEHLRTDGTIVFLHVEFERLLERIDDYDQRGIARRPDQSFRDLFACRQPGRSRHVGCLSRQLESDE